MHLITGGERSGKSRYAQRLAEARSDHPTYLATAVRSSDDEAFARRIDRHQQARDHRWTTIEEPLYLHQVLPKQGTVMVDCVTLWLSNWLAHCQGDRDATLVATQQEIDRMLLTESTLFVVSNEVGMGLHASTQVGRDFVELQGWVNQYIAQRAERVTFMVAGLPLTIK